MNTIQLLQISQDIQEQIEICGELWDLSDFEVTALCGIVADAFAERGVTMQQSLEDLKL
jgi:hypothetical protein